MEKIKLTTGSGFSGYEVVEYLGFVNGQSALSSNLFKDLSLNLNLTEWTTQERVEFTDMLENAGDNAVEKLIKAAEKKGANAIIGIKLNYAGFSSNAIGTVASGTAVRIEPTEVIRRPAVSKLYVSNYYNAAMPRPTEIVLRESDNVVNVALIIYNYGREDIKTIRCDIELTNYYEEKHMLQDVDFVIKKSDNIRIETEFVQCELPVKEIPLIKDAKIYVKKYVTGDKGVITPEVEPTDVTLSRKMFEGLREKCGKDLVERYKSDGITWTCICGCINNEDNKDCAVCGRKEEDVKSDVGFDYEEMCNRMRGLPNVSAMKDVLMEYIKRGELENKYRMELLEIMESGLQYEKTRGDMTESVLERVIMVFGG